LPRVDTRLALMRAAEQLFAEQGVDRVSLREIAIAAGQRNVSAATYHFGGKRELIEAILERHSRPIRGAWLDVLQNEQTRNQLDLRRLVELLVRPIAAKIDDADGGRHYLGLCAELISSRSFPLMGMSIVTAPGAAELTALLAAQGPALPEELRLIRNTRLAGIIFGSIGDYLRLSASGLEIPRRVFVADLVNVLIAAIRADAPCLTE
jgi:AcrR family transcriptional regulator